MFWVKILAGFDLEIMWPRHSPWPRRSPGRCSPRTPRSRCVRSSRPQRTDSDWESPPSWPRRTGMPLPPPDGSAEFLGQRDNDAFGAAEVAEQKDVLVPHHLADELGAMGPQAGDGVLDVVDGEHKATDAQRVRRCVLRLGADHRRLLVAHQLELAVAVRSPHHGDVDALAVESDDAVRPLSLDRHHALQRRDPDDWANSPSVPGSNICLTSGVASHG